MLITHANIWSYDEECTIVEDGAALIKDGRIAALGPTAEIGAAYAQEETLDAAGRVLAPGNICLHTHTYGAFARGMALKDAAPENFVQILERLWWRLDRALTLEDVRLSALTCLVDAIRHGTTTLVDHHASPRAIEGSLDVLAEAVEEAGLRACLCYEVTDRGGPGEARAGIAENARFARRVQKRGRGQLAALMGLHASLTLSPQTLAEAVSTAQDLGIGVHTHVAEDGADVEDSLKHYGCRPVERLANAGAIGPNTIFAHCVHVNEGEMDILAETGTPVAHNPRSNQNNAVGTAPVPAMLARGVRLGLGNDGFSNDMFREMATAYLVHKAASGDPRALPADQVLDMAAHQNAAVASRLLGVPLGHIVVGAAADLILLDYDPPTPVTPENLPWHVIFGLAGGMVHTTIVAGRILMRDRQIVTLDEAAIMARAREQARQVWLRV